MIDTRSKPEDDTKEVAARHILSQALRGVENNMTPHMINFILKTYPDYVDYLLKKGDEGLTKEDTEFYDTNVPTIQ